jgi:hypothetical protein
VRWSPLDSDGPRCVWARDDALDDLQAGTLRPTGGNPDRAAWDARRLLQAYPGLRAEFLDYHGRTVAQTMDEIARLVAEGEVGGRATQRTLSPAEERAAVEVRRWHREVTATIEPVPVPPRADLPQGDPWAADDAAFREWLIDQTLVGQPRTRPDADLQRMLLAQRGLQKPTHQGWEICQHAIAAAIVLEADEFPVPQRRALRVAALLHDVGKTINVWTPGCHALIGAKIWRRWAPSWLSPEEGALVTALIATHDVLGLLDRALLHEGYPGGLSPQDVRERLVAIAPELPAALRLVRAIYHADIGSVAALRWLLPLTPLLERVVLAGADG